MLLLGRSFASFDLLTHRTCITWVINRFEKLNLSPAQRLQLAQMYGIPQWIAPATQQFINTPLDDIAASDTKCLDLWVYTIIAQAHERVEIECRSIGVVPPGLSLMPSLECSSTKHSICKDVWAQVWWNKVAYWVLHPTNPLHLSAVFDYVTGLPDPRGLNPQCKAKFLEQIVATGTLGVEDLVIEGAIKWNIHIIPSSHVAFLPLYFPLHALSPISRHKVHKVCQCE